MKDGMCSNLSLHQDEHGQTALETAITLIAFILVASIFAFTMLSSGTSSTEKGKQAIFAGLEGVQSTMSLKGSIIAKGTSPDVDAVIFKVSLIAGGSPVNLSDSAKEMIIGYKDADQFVNNIDWTVSWLNSNEVPPDDILETGESAEITVILTGLSPRLGVNTNFTIEIKPPTGAVLNFERTTPPAIRQMMDLH